MDWTDGAKNRYTRAARPHATLLKQKSFFANKRATASSCNAGSGKLHESSANLRNYLDSPAEKSEDQLNPGHMDMPLQRRGSGDRKVSIRSSKPSSLAKKEYSAHNSTREGVSMYDEEQLLLANRKRLLGRGDWLGLKPLRRVSIAFPSSRNKDRIGKRRKISKSEKHGMPKARQRSLTPLFADHEVPAYQPVMSGALPARGEAIEIKIGTEAFESQNPQSLSSRHWAATSMRNPSTDPDAISEESMLLDAEDDLFEREVLTEATEGAISVQYVAQDNAMSETEDDRFLKISPSMVVSWHGSKARETEATGAYLDEDIIDRQYTTHCTVSRDLQPETSAVDTQEDSMVYETRNQPHHPTLAYVPATPNVIRANDTDDDEEDIWRRLMPVNQHIPSNFSTLAVQSATLHTSQSAVIEAPSTFGSDYQYQPVDPGSRSYTLHETQTLPIVESYRRTSDHNPGSVSASLKQILSLSKLSPEQTQDGDINSDEDVWRKFVIGCPSDSSNAQRQHRNIWKSAEMSLEPISQSSPETAARTDRATVAESLFVSEANTSSTYDGSVRRPTNTSMVAHAATVFADEDKGSRNLESSQPHGTGSRNIHARQSQTRRLLKKLKERDVKLLRDHSRFLPPRRIHKVPSSSSVYDLPESD